jgi:O-antigen ligase
VARVLEAGVMRRILEFGLVTSIFLAVGSFGGTEPIFWGIVQALILLLGLLLAVHPPRRPWRPARNVLWIPVVLIAWVAIQWLGSRSGRIGADTHAIEMQGLAFITSIVAFCVVLEVMRERESRWRLALCLVTLGLFEAVYGLLQYLTGWQYIWTVPRRFYMGSATGTYVNHNHFAGFLEMIFPLALGLASYHAQKVWPRSGPRSPRDFLDRLGHPEMLKSLLLLLVATVLFLATVFSLSRMGVISMFVSLGVMAAADCARKNRSLLPAALIVILMAAGAATTAWVGVAPVVEHFGQLAQNEMAAQGDGGRIALWKNAWTLIREHPWTGVGLGCFEFAFTTVQSIQLTYVADHAHNDYLELAAELGLPAATLLFSLFLWLAGKTLHASLCARSNLGRALALGSLGGISALLVHSAADFNLYIPANALVFAVLLGIGFAISLDESAIDLRYQVGAEKPSCVAADARLAGAEEAEEIEAGFSESRSH